MEERALIQYQSRDGQEIKLSFEVVRKYLVSGKKELVTDAEIMLYMGMCKSRGLNPFIRDCYLVKYTSDDPAATIVSIDYYRARARAQADCRGWSCGIIVRVSEDQIIERRGTLLYEEEELLGGWFTARPAGWDIDYYHSVDLNHYVKTTREGKPTKFWQDRAYMISKVAESQGLRRVWPNEFSKLYIKEEIVGGVPLQATEEPIREPQAIEEGRDGQQEQETGVDAEAGGSGHGNGPAEQRGEADSMDAPDQSQNGDDAKPDVEAPPKDKKADLLDWLHNRATPEEILSLKNYLTEGVKGMKAKDQQEVVSAWNRKRRELQQAGK